MEGGLDAQACMAPLGGPRILRFGHLIARTPAGLARTVAGRLLGASCSWRNAKEARDGCPAEWALRCMVGHAAHCLGAWYAHPAKQHQQSCQHPQHSRHQDTLSSAACTSRRIVATNKYVATSSSSTPTACTTVLSSERRNAATYPDYILHCMLQRMTSCWLLSQGTGTDSASIGIRAKAASPSQRPHL